MKIIRFSLSKSELNSECYRELSCSLYKSSQIGLYWYKSTPGSERWAAGYPYSHGTISSWSGTGALGTIPCRLTLNWVEGHTKIVLVETSLSRFWGFDSFVNTSYHLSCHLRYLKYTAMQLFLLKNHPKSLDIRLHISQVNSSLDDEALSSAVCNAGFGILKSLLFHASSSSSSSSSFPLK